MESEHTDLLNSITITGKKKSFDKLTEINYSYKIYFDSINREKAKADLALAEELINGRNSNLEEKKFIPSSPKSDAI